MNYLLGCKELLLVVMMVLVLVLLLVAHLVRWVRWLIDNNSVVVQ